MALNTSGDGSRNGSTFVTERNRGRILNRPPDPHPLEQTPEEDAAVQALRQKLALPQLIGKNAAFLAEKRKISLVARCDASVLISGETGTGKEVCARAIHYLSARAHKPFTPVNCGAIPVELVENELFGHARGAFTGASASQHGLIHEAEGGTLFLDEIDCLPSLAQVKLLRFLQEKEYRSLGSARTYQADVRVITATNTDIDGATSEGRLRRDLYYRLNIIRLVLPPLRERQGDIPLLARHFLAKYVAEFNKLVTDISPDAMQMLVLYEWPGNIRELEHLIERAVVLSEQAVLQTADIDLPGVGAGVPDKSFRDAKAKAIAEFERTYIEGLLLAHHGNISKAAQAARKNRRAFWQLMHKYRIDAHSFISAAAS
jgi:two-component system response regulator GlrR